ncbi:unnamed protein product [Alopecurus aequalis]
MSHPSRSAVEFLPQVPNDEVEEAVLSCSAFGSEDGYKAFSLAECHMHGDVAMRLARGRRYVPSPYGGMVFVTDMCGRHPCHVVDPFTGEVTPLPDMPVPLCEEVPMPYGPKSPKFRLSTDDGFFCETGGVKWTPVHRSRQCSPMTINYRADFFFMLELGSLRTTVIDAETLDPSTEIDPPPRLHNITWAFLVASADDVLLLVRHCLRNRFSDADGDFFQAYRARHMAYHAQHRPIRWERVMDIGDRAVFLDHAHDFTVCASEGTIRNCVYRAMIVKLEKEEEEGKSSRRDDVALVVVVSPLSDLRKMKLVQESEVLTRCKVDPIWGGGYWIIHNHGLSPS